MSDSSHDSDPDLVSSRQLIEALRSGAAGAAETIYDRYMGRLTQLARARLSTQVARRVDPEDVVMSAWRSFFAGVTVGRFETARSGDLWRLLASITAHKASHQVRHHMADKRSVLKDILSGDLIEMTPASSLEPSAEEVLIFSEEVEQLMSSVDSMTQRIVELRLRDETLTAIAKDMKCSERTVRRRLEYVRSMLSEREVQAGE